MEGHHDFPQQFSEFSFKTLLTKPEVINAITKIKVECAKVRTRKGMAHASAGCSVRSFC